MTDAELASYFATSNLAVTYAMDGEAGQHFDSQRPGAVNDWPTEIVSYLFPAGAFQFLDGGTLDLGLVRDSTLNAANDFSTFMETFEAVAFVAVRRSASRRRSRVRGRAGGRLTGMGTRDPRCSTLGCKLLAVPDQNACLRHGGVVPVRPVGGAPINHMGLCGATRRDGGLCRQPRMKGASRCRSHGASAPQVQRKAKELVAQSIIERDARHYGQPRNISAIDALTEELHRTQGHVDRLGQQVAARPQDANLLAVYTAERGHLAKLAGQMVSAKLDGQRSVFDEKAVERLELALTGILRDLGHDPSDAHMRQVVARRLRCVGAARLDGSMSREAAIAVPHLDQDASQPTTF